MAAVKGPFKAQFAIGVGEGGEWGATAPLILIEMDVFGQFVGHGKICGSQNVPMPTDHTARNIFRAK